MNHLLFYLLLTFSLCMSVDLRAEPSLEERVGQLFFGVVYGETLDEATCAFLERTHLGNVVYFSWANGLHSPEQVRALSGQLTTAITKITGTAPLIAVDQEGGRVARLTHGFTTFASNESIGCLDDPTLAFEMGVVIGQELASVGVTMNFAPVVDVNVNPNNSVIGSRSYGADPTLVTAMAAQFIAGHRQSGVATVLKHFPGHGDTNVNSHQGLPVVDKDLASLQAIELAPFRHLMHEADALMTAHLLVPALDPLHPASTSSPILTDLLRKEWGYNGVVISDSLAMRAIAPDQSSLDQAIVSVSRAAIDAFNAGCDLLLLGALEWADFHATQRDNERLMEEVITLFCNAVRSGEISSERIEASLMRIQRIKADRP